MLKKALMRCANVLLAMLLVFVVSEPMVWAQETTAGATDSGATDSGATDGGSVSPSEPGKIRIDLRGAGDLKTIQGLSVSPASFDLGLFIMGETPSTSALVTLSNTRAAGEEPISISGATLIGANPDEFSTSFPGFATLMPGDSMEVVVTMTPTFPGEKSMALRLDIDGSDLPYTLFATGKARYALTSDLTASTVNLNLGQVLLGAQSNKQLVLTNDGQPGSPVINVTDIIKGGNNPAAFNLNFNPMTLAPGQSGNINVNFKSGAEGPKNASLEIVHDGNNQNIEVELQGEIVDPNGTPTNFTQKALAGVTLDKPTSIQIGPDGKLYVAERDGLIKVATVARAANGTYSGTLVDTITQVKNTPNHDDDGDPNNLKTRLVTGLFVTGTPAVPVIWVTSSDPRFGGGGGSGSGAGTNETPNFVNADSNSGILHKLTKNGNGWIHQEVVRGLPRSGENHAPNGLLMQNGKILLVTGGHTNQGAPSFRFVYYPEYALSAAILEIDVNAIGANTYDLPTLDDDSRANQGGQDVNDPFGGNKGKNQAKLVNGGPVQIYSTGYRNSFDIAMTPSGKLYTIDNGPNGGWGAAPQGCSNNVPDIWGGANSQDHLHLVTKGSYGGHPNPTRGSKNNTFNSDNVSPIEGAAMPADCDYKKDSQDGSLRSFNGSTNGLTAYGSSAHFGGEMYGDLVTASYRDKSIIRIKLNDAGDVVLYDKPIALMDKTPLDVWAQGDGQPYAGTLWSVSYFDNKVTVLEPEGY